LPAVRAVQLKGIALGDAANDENAYREAVGSRCSAFRSESVEV
jgi:hypothetical protein